METLFHEFGHGLQHMLTTMVDGDCAGINGVEWDAVELPSQFMENWCYHKPTVDQVRMGVGLCVRLEHLHPFSGDASDFGLWIGCVSAF